MLRNLLTFLSIILVTIGPGFFNAYGQEQDRITDTLNFIKNLMDQNKDGKVSIVEYERFYSDSDRNKDDYLMKEEIHEALSKRKGKVSSIPEMADLLMKFLDVTENQKVSKIEYISHFTNTDQDKDDFLDQKELYEYAKKLLHVIGPKEGSVAPDFSLKTTNDVIFKLSDLKGKDTVVLIFGSCKSPSIKSQAAGLNGVYQTYKEKSSWYMVYIQETNLSKNTAETKTRTMEERIASAKACQNELGLEFPVLVDDADNKVEKAYAAWPERIYVVDKKGNIGYKSEPGDGFDYRVLGQRLRKICFT